MGKMRVRKVLIRIIMLLAIASSVYIVKTKEVDTDGTMRLLDEYVMPYYEVLSPNVGITNINGISNVYINMAAEGYELYENVVTNDYVDVSFVKDGEPSYRYYFSYPDGRITFLCSDYESSYQGITYITEKK